MLTRRPSPGRVLAHVPFHPVGLSAVPILFLFAQNQVQQVTLDPLWRPLALAVLMAAGLLVTCAAVLWDWQRGALLASLLLALFYSYGHAWNLAGSFLGDRLWLAGIYLVVAVLGAALVWRGGGWVASASGFANVVAVLLLVFNTGRVVDFAVGSASPVGGGTPSPPAGIDASGPRPDIYYLIFDRYAGPETLERVYGHDNEPFLAELERRGFTVARDAWANYFKTALSLTASLSMDYLDPARFPADADGFGLVHRALREHLEVPATLTAIGYEYVHVASYWEPTSTNVDADISVRYQDASEFESAVRATTLLSLLEEPQPEDSDPETIPFPDLARETTLYAFQAVEAAAGRPGPTFVFAHILVPHPPYVFDADGTMPTAEESETRTEEEEYAAQLAWANGRIVQLLDRLLDVPPGEEPIIIVQGDEGPFPDRYRLIGERFQWFTATSQEVAQKFGILNAVHLPGIDPVAAGYSSHTSPVNNFRVVLNAYFDADLPLLPDVAYLSRDHVRPYELREYRRLEGS
jgi:hypothetical protein